MEIDALKPILGHLSTQFERARPILLTGAGFSAATKNINKKNVPMTSELKRIIWPLCFGPDEYEENSTLQDLYQIAKANRGTELKETLIKELSVDTDSIPSWYQEIFEFPWFRCYTLNIDNLAEGIQAKYKISRKLLIIPATSSRMSEHLIFKQKDVLEVVHLNGDLSDLPDKVTFSFSQYADRISKDDPWYHRFTTDLLSRPVVFIGTQLDEPPLWQHVERRRQKGGREQYELRPKSYLVVPELSKARRACLSQYNVTWIPLTADAFVESILKPIKTSAEVGKRFLSDSQNQESIEYTRIPEVADLAINPNEPNEYLMGAEPIWADIQSNRAIERNSDKEIWEEISRTLEEPDCKGYILISGSAGTGKSTALRRIALRLSAKGLRVGWIDRSIDISIRTILSSFSGEECPSVVAIDDADIMGTSLSPLIFDLCNKPSHPLVIAAIRSGKIDRVINPAQLRLIRSKEVVIPSLTDNDIDELIDVLDRESRLGALAGKPREKQQKIFREKCGRQILVAMIEATSGRPFEQKIEDEFLELEVEGQVIYATIALATSFRFTLSKSELLLSMGEPTNQVLNTIRNMVHRNLIVENFTDNYQSRHRVIADHVVDYLIKNGQLTGINLGLARAVASEISAQMPVTARPRRLLKQLLNHEILKRSVGREGAKNFYGDLEPLLSDDYSYWLHRGSLEVEEGDINFAEVCLNYARGLNPDDQNTQTEYAYLLFRKAISFPRSPVAIKYIEDAKDLLIDNIASRGSRDPHSYHVLGSNMFKWIKICDWSNADKKVELEKIYELIKEGKDKHPKNRALFDLFEELDMARNRIGLLSLPIQ